MTSPMPRLTKQRFYQANPGCPIFEELCGIVLKTLGLAEPLRDALAALARRIELAFVYGSVAKRVSETRAELQRSSMRRAGLLFIINVNY